MRNGIAILPDSSSVIRLVSISLIAIGVIACGMVIVGWRYLGMMLGLLLVTIAGVLVYQVHRGVKYFTEQSKTLQEASLEAEGHYVDVLKRVVGFVEARDKYKRGHSERVAELAEKIAAEMNLSQAQPEQLKLAGELHDIGLVAVSDSMLNSRSSLGADAYRKVQEHPNIAHEVLSPLNSLNEILPAIRHHHERMNGTGYPDGLAGDAIPMIARILAVADSYDAMTNDRPYREAMTALIAVEELRRCSPDGYDEKCVEALAEVLNIPQISEVVRLAAAS